jgi:hypothetical protein
MKIGGEIPLGIDEREDEKEQGGHGSQFVAEKNYGALIAKVSKGFTLPIHVQGCTQPSRRVLQSHSIHGFGHRSRRKALHLERIGCRCWDNVQRSRTESNNAV